MRFRNINIFVYIGFKYCLYSNCRFSVENRPNKYMYLFTQAPASSEEIRKEKYGV